MPGQLHSTLWSLLRLAYYFLSSRNIGTTLVWRIRDPRERTVEGLSNKGLDVREMNLGTNDESEYSVIEHLLSWALRNSSGVGEGVHNSVVQTDGEFPYIMVGG